MTANVTLVNFNLMYAVVDGKIDFQVYNPLGLLSIGACLKREGFDVELRDFQLYARDHMDDPFNLDGFAELMAGCGDVIAFSCMSNLLPFALLCGQRLKRDHPDKLLVLGGVGPTGVPREVMETFHWVDLVCQGEGELSMVELMQRVASGWQPGDEVIQGFHQRFHGGIAYVPRERIQDLDGLPLPDYDLVDFAQYDAAPSLITSRGCPYHCTFCTETNHWGNHVVFRGEDSIIDELRLLAELMAPREVVLFQDDQLTQKRSRAMHFFQRLIDEDLGLLFKCFVRVDQVDEELLSLMAEAGCIQVRFGIESGSNRVLRKIRKGFTIEEAFEVVRTAVRVIPSVHASFIWGYPFETVDECRETLKAVKTFRKAGATVLNFMLSPLPNSDIYRDYAGPLDFNESTIANFNVSGGEDITVKGTRINPNTRYLFNFIQRYPRLFPGFFVYDYGANIKPKKRLVQKKRWQVFRGMRRLKIRGYDKVDL